MKRMPKAICKLIILEMELNFLKNTKSLDLLKEEGKLNDYEYEDLKQQLQERIKDVESAVKFQKQLTTKRM